MYVEIQCHTESGYPDFSRYNSRVSHSVGDPPIKLFMMQSMTSDLAQTKAVRRRTLRDGFPHPLNQIALRHVDSVAALSDTQRLILSKAVQKSSLRDAAAYIDALNQQGIQIQNEDDLVALIPTLPVKKAEKANGHTNTNGVNTVDTDCLTNLLLKCYPDMPRTSANALARADVMEAPLQVVRATRNAIEKTNSDFVVITLFTMFEEKLNELKDLINANPAFIKAIQLSRPNWKSGR